MKTPAESPDTNPIRKSLARDEGDEGIHLEGGEAEEQGRACAGHSGSLEHCHCNINAINTSDTYAKYYHEL